MMRNRSQRHTLDALELRGGVLMKAGRVRLGDTILDLEGDYVVNNQHFDERFWDVDDYVYVLHPRTAPAK